MTFRTRPSSAVVFGAIILLAACDSRSPTPVEPRASDTKPNLQVVSATRPITGIWSAVVTEASDLNDASFGRPASEWIGKTVTGSFSIQLTAPGVGDRNRSPNAWEFGPVPGPGPFIEFVTVSALIDGKAFQSSRAEYQNVFFGDVLLVDTSSVASSFRPQDSFVGVGAPGVGRSVVGFDTYFAAGGISYDGNAFALVPGLLRTGRGVIDDLLENQGLVVRKGTISFNVTGVSLSPAASLLTSVIELTGAGALGPDQAAGLLDRINTITLRVEAGNVNAACNQLAIFAVQVQVIGIRGFLTPTARRSLTAQTVSIRRELGC